MKYSIIKGGKCFLLILLVYSSYGGTIPAETENSPREIYFKSLCPSRFKGRIISTLGLSLHRIKHDNQTNSSTWNIQRTCQGPGIELCVSI